MDARKYDSVVLVLIIIVALVFMFLGLPGLREQASLFPRAILVLLAGLSALLLLKTLFVREKTDDGVPRKVFAGVNGLRVTVVLISSAIYVFAATTIGFYVSTFVFVTALSLFLDDDKLTFKAVAVSALVSIAVCGFLYASFDSLLNVSVPRGLLF